MEVFGPYRLISRLGAGGMGEVWRARDTRKDREVAVKVMGAWLGAEPGFAARFCREAASAARLNAPNIIPVHDYGELDGRLFMEMPLIDGTDLGTLIGRHGRLEPTRTVGILEQVADALDTAHAAGLVHRDVKPSNVLVSPRLGGRDFAYLIDFGIARAAGDTHLTTTGHTPGTLAYTALRVWDLATRQPVGSPITDPAGPVDAVTTAQFGGRPMVIYGSYDKNTVRVVDLAAHTG